MIGAGLQTLEKGGDGAALKELFYMFAVTREDVVHPMAVIELLWRACCHQTVETQDDAAKLQSRLKLRQRITLLVDRSLLLGSSTSGVHVHGEWGSLKYRHYLELRLTLSVAVATNQTSY